MRTLSPRPSGRIGASKFGAATLNEDKTLARVEIILPDGYEEAQTAREKIQLVKGACHLAQLLNAIRYQ